MTDALVTRQIETANQRANTAGCCGWVHHAAMYVEIALIIGAIALAILGGTGVISFVYASIGVVLAVAFAASIGIAYNRMYIVLGTLKQVVRDLEEEVGEFRELTFSLNEEVRNLSQQNQQYQEANVAHLSAIERLEGQNAEYHSQNVTYAQLNKEQEVLVSKLEQDLDNLTNNANRVLQEVLRIQSIEAVGKNAIVVLARENEIKTAQHLKKEEALNQQTEELVKAQQSLNEAHENHLKEEERLNQRTEELQLQQQKLNEQDKQMHEEQKREHLKHIEEIDRLNKKMADLQEKMSEYFSKKHQEEV
jgi:hypothetical protein